MTMFYVGDRVVCLRGGFGDFADDSPDRVRLCPHIPIRGLVYTVSECHISSTGEHLVRLGELPNPRNFAGAVPWFFARRFAPIRATDISVFERMLKSEPA